MVVGTDWFRMRSCAARCREEVNLHPYTIYSITWLLGSRGGHRASTNDLHSTGFWANHFTSPRFLPSSLISLSTNLLHVIFSLPRFPFPRRFHSKASRLMSSFGLPRVLLSNQTSSPPWRLQQGSLFALLLNSSFIISSVVKSLTPCLCNEAYLQIQYIH